MQATTASTLRQSILSPDPKSAWRSSANVLCTLSHFDPTNSSTRIQPRVKEKGRAVIRRRVQRGSERIAPWPRSGTGFQPVSENTTGKMPVPLKPVEPACSTYPFAVPNTRPPGRQRGAPRRGGPGHLLRSWHSAEYRPAGRIDRGERSRTEKLLHPTGLFP
jgi:hypothetical protein